MKKKKKVVKRRDVPATDMLNDKSGKNTLLLSQDSASLRKQGILQRIIVCCFLF